MKMVGGLHLRAAVLAALILVPAGARADQDAPSGAAPGGPRSRLTLAGSFETNAYRQKNFFLGSEIADTTASGYFGDKNGHWTQRLDLFPRLILADNLNVNLAMALAHGVWGLDASTAGVNRSGVTNLFNNKSSFFALQVDWAYLAYRNSWTKTRWYLGRQAFGMGNLLSLDMDATGLQLYRDLGGSLAGVGYAKVSEGGGLSERDGAAVPDTIAHPRTGPDSRDADLLFAEYRMGSEKGAFHLNPFVLRYSDKNTADSVAYLPDMQGYLDARFRPQVSQATVLGLAGHVKKGIGRLDFEGNLLKGKDKIRNRNSGILQLHDRNNGPEGDEHPRPRDFRIQPAAGRRRGGARVRGRQPLFRRWELQLPPEPGSLQPDRGLGPRSRARREGARPRGARESIHPRIPRP